MRKTVAQYYAAHGFEIHPTGGGCAGFIRYSDKDEPDLGGYLFVTAAGTANPPETMTEPVSVGFYNSVGDRQGLTLPSSKQFLMWLEPL